MTRDWRALKEEVRARNSLLEVVRGYGVELRRSGRTWAGRCPFHPDTRPSFHIYPDGFYHCFGCGAHGDVIDFVARAEGVEWREAALMLAGSQIGGGCIAPQVAEEEREPRPEELTAVHAAWEACRRHLSHLHAQEYLAKRGIPMAAADALGLGYWAAGVATRLEGMGLVEPSLKVGLLRRRQGRPYWEPFRGRLIIADLDREGRARWLTGRATDDETQPKYLNLSLPKPLLGIDLVEGEEVTLVEGPLDWVAARAMGLPAAATLGAHVSRLRLVALARFQRVLVLFDADEAGRQAARDLAKALGQRAAIVTLPKGVKDVADLLLLPGGGDRLREAIERARGDAGHPR